MVCDQIAETRKDENPGKPVYFCPAVLPEDREYKDDPNSVVCPESIDCKAQKAAFEAVLSNRYSLQRGAIRNATIRREKIREYTKSLER